jgi:hypothetical protein
MKVLGSRAKIWRQSPRPVHNGRLKTIEMVRKKC